MKKYHNSPLGKDFSRGKMQDGFPANHPLLRLQIFMKTLSQSVTNMRYICFVLLLAFLSISNQALGQNPADVWYIGGSNGAIYTNANEVGIRVSNPQAVLHVKGPYPEGRNGILSLFESASNGDVGIGFKRSGSDFAVLHNPQGGLSFFSGRSITNPGTVVATFGNIISTNNAPDGITLKHVLGNTYEHSEIKIEAMESSHSWGIATEADNLAFNLSSDEQAFTIFKEGAIGLGLPGRVQINYGDNGTIRYLNDHFEGKTSSGWVNFGPDGSSIWSLNGGNAYYTEGFVGVGLNDPSTRLHVQGADPSPTQGILTTIENLASGATGISLMNADNAFGMVFTESGGLTFHQGRSPSNAGKAIMSLGQVVGTNMRTGLTLHNRTGSGYTFSELQIETPSNVSHNWGIGTEGADLGVNLSTGEEVFKIFSGDGSIALGKTTGDKAQGSNGSIRYNNDRFEGKTSTGWVNFGGGVWSLNGTNAYYNNGNVGIGLNDPDTKLEIRTASANTNGLKISRDENNYMTIDDQEIFFHSEQNGLSFYNGSGAYLSDAVLASSFGLADDGSGVLMSARLHFSPGPGYAIFLSAHTGNVGIGTNNPQEKLEVVDGTTKTQLGDLVRVQDMNGTNYGLMQKDQIHIYNTTSSGLRESINKSDELVFLRAEGNENTALVGLKQIGNNLGFIASTNTGDRTARMTLDTDGRLGIGVAAPSTRLHVKGFVTVENVDASNAPMKFVIVKSVNNTAVNLGTTTNHHLNLGTNGHANLLIEKDNGQVILEPSDEALQPISASLKSKYQLFVPKGILSEDYALAPVAQWADYVFEEDYELSPLSEVEGYIKENNHLPDVPSAKEIAEDGYSLHDMNVKFLRKIEELTLYTIEQQKEIKAMKAEMEAMKKMMEQN